MGMENANSPPPKRAGRPRAFDRDQALNQALELFWRHGFEGTSTAQLTTAMGIAPPSCTPPSDRKSRSSARRSLFMAGVMVVS